MEQRRRSIIVIVLGGLAALGPFSVDMYLPGFPAIARDLGTDVAHVGLTLTSYFIGFSLGQLVFGPILDRFGRKGPLTAGLIVYVAAAIGCALAPSIHYLIGLRVLLALGSCVGMVGSSTVIRDLFSGREVARALSMMMTIFGVAPIIAPSVGGIVVATLGWRAIFVVLGTLALVMLVAVRSTLPETRGADAGVSLRPKKVALSYFQVLEEPQFVLFVLTSAVGAGGMFAYISGSPFIFINILGFSAAQFGWIFGANGLAMVLGNQVNRFLLKKHEPVHVLIGATLGQAVLGLLLLTGTVTGIIPKIGFCALVFLFMFCSGFIGSNSGAMALMPFSRNIGAASALLGGIMMGSGAMVSALVSYLDNGTAIPMVLAMSLCSAVGLLLSVSGSLLLKKGRLGIAG